MIGFNNHTLLERRMSSAECSTSYPASPRPTNRQCKSTCRVRGSGGRCDAQQRPYRGSHSPEREPPRRSGPVHRPLSLVAASATTASPPLPLSRHAGLHSGHPDLNTCIPDAIPSLEQLEDLRTRAMKASHRRVASLIQRDLSDRVTMNSNPARHTASPNGCRSSSSGEAIQSYADTVRILAPDDPTVDAPSADRSGADNPALAMTPSVVPLRSALSRAVAPPHLPAQPQPSRGGGGVASQFRKGNALGPKRYSSFNPPTTRPFVSHTMAIKSERNWRQLPGLLADLAPAGRLDAFTASVFLTHLAQLVAKSPPVLQSDQAIVECMQTTLLGSVEFWMHEYRARQISNMTWALARLGLPSGAAFVREHLLPASYPLLPWYEPQHLSNTLWALATIGVAPDDEWLEEYLTVAFVALQKRALAPQHLANVLWALERMGVMPDQEWMAAYYDCVQAAAVVANPQDCSNILSCLALMRMHQQQPAATVALVGRLAQRLQALLAPDAVVPAPAAAVSAGEVDAAVLTPTPAHSAGAGLPEPAGDAVDVSDQAIANSLWALAIMDVQPAEGLWEAVVATLRQRLADSTRFAPGMHPVALTIVLWASSTLSRQLPEAVVGLVYGRVRAAQMEAMEPRSLATMVWALATAPKAQMRPPPNWVADVVAVSGHSLAPFGAQAVSNMLYGLCQLGARPPPTWMSAVINHFHRNLGSEASGQSLSNVLWCLAKMGYRLNAEGMDILFGLVRSQLAAWQQQSRQQQEQQQEQPSVLPPFNSQEISNVLYAIASMGYEIDPDGELAHLLLDAVRARLAEANAQELSNLMWCLTVLQIRPAQPWLDDYFAAAQARLHTFTPFDLAQTFYGAAKLRLPLQPLSNSPTNADDSRRILRKFRAPATARTLTPAPASPATSKPAAGAPAVGTFNTAAANWMSAALDVLPQLIASANAQDLCNLSWALVQLRVPVQADSPIVAAFTSRLVALAGGCEPSQLALGVWALGKWRAKPSRAHMERLELATFRQVPSMRPHELAAMLSGFTGMAHKAPVEWVSDAMQQVAARSREFGPQEWTMVVYALARIQDDTSLTEMVLRLLPRLDRMPLPSLILISYSCGCMGPSPMGQRLVSRCLTLLAAGGGAATPAAAAGAAAATAHAKIGNKGAPGFGAAPAASAAGRAAVVQAQVQLAASHCSGSGNGSGAALAAVGAGVDLTARPVAVASLTPVELSALLWSAVRVGIKVLPRDFMDHFLSYTEPLLEDLPASLVAAYLWAAGRLKMWLPARWRKLLLRRAKSQLPKMHARELAMCMAGLLWLRMWPTSSLLQKLHGCYEAQREQMPEYVRKHADMALTVLTKRLARAQERELKFSCRRGTRLRWLARVWQGNERAAAAGAIGYGAKRVTAAKPPGYVTRRGALRLGVLRRRPQSAKATEAVDKAARGHAAGDK